MIVQAQEQPQTQAHEMIAATLRAYGWDMSAAQVVWSDLLDCWTLEQWIPAQTSHPSYMLRLEPTAGARRVRWELLATGPLVMRQPTVQEGWEDTPFNPDR